MPPSSSLSRPPAPGREESAAGLPLGGLATGCAGPVSGSWVAPVPLRPGYPEVEYALVTSPRSSALKPATREYVELLAGAPPSPRR